MPAQPARQIGEPRTRCNGHDKLPGEVRRDLRRGGAHLLGLHRHDQQFAERRGLPGRAEAAHPQFALQPLARLGNHLDDVDGPGREPFSSRPPMMARAMLPPPMNVMFIRLPAT